MTAPVVVQSPLIQRTSFGLVSQYTTIIPTPNPAGTVARNAGVGFQLNAGANGLRIAKLFARVSAADQPTGVTVQNIKAIPWRLSVFSGTMPFDVSATFQKIRVAADITAQTRPDAALFGAALGVDMLFDIVTDGTGSGGADVGYDSTTPIVSQDGHVIDFVTGGPSCPPNTSMCVLLIPLLFASATPGFACPVSLGVYGFEEHVNTQNRQASLPRYEYPHNSGGF